MEKAKEKKPMKKPLKIALTIFYWVFIVICVLLVAFNIYIRVGCDCIIVDGTSMCDTLQDGDVLFSTKTTCKRGDIVIIDTTNKNSETKADFSGENIIKRVIATGGDTLYRKDNQIYIKYSGESEFTLLKEDYITPSRNTNRPDIPETTIAQGEVYVMGDNRNVSKDSSAIISSNFFSTTYVGTFHESDVKGVVTGWSITFKGILTTFYGGMANKTN